MAEAQTEGTIREAVGVFKDAKSLENAVDELESSGFDRAEISLLASEETVEQKLGHKYKKVTELENDASVPRSAFVSTESIGDAEGGLIGGLMYVGAVAAAGAVVASGGTIGAAIIAAATLGGAGGLVGSILAKVLGEHYARHIQEQLEHGGLLLWVQTRDQAGEGRAAMILSQHGAHDVHIHSFPSAMALRP